jgi:putative two-component system response regulator
MRCRESGEVLLRSPRQRAQDLVAALARHDPVTGAHLQRLPFYTRLLVEDLATHPRHRLSLRAAGAVLPQASTLHDVGKLRVSEWILCKRGPLAADEFAAMKLHTTAGGRALQELGRLDPEDRFLVLGHDVALYHHERWNGSGYPFGLRGAQIPLAARIVALADVYDALTSERPYKPAFDHTVARKLILAQAGAHFDPDVVEAFLATERNFLDTALRSQTPAVFAAPIAAFTLQAR